MHEVRCKNVFQIYFGAETNSNITGYSIRALLRSPVNRDGLIISYHRKLFNSIWAAALF